MPLTTWTGLGPDGTSPRPKPWKKYLTAEQYGDIGSIGRMMADYWIEFLPKMSERLHREGKLYPTLLEAGERLSNEMVEMMQQGVPEDAALEIVKEEVYQLPPEK